jgi:hypothetical protein
MVFPPSTTRFAPLIIAAASLARNMAAYAISLGFAKRPTGISARASSPFSSPQKKGGHFRFHHSRRDGVDRDPPQSPLDAMDRSIPSKPAFDAA